MNGAVKIIKKAIKNKNKTVEDLTVVRFVSGGKYNYAAIYIATMGMWYLTTVGNYYVRASLSNDEFLELMNRSGISNIQVASSWEDVN